MPVLIVWGFPEDMGEKINEYTHMLIQSVSSIKGLNLNETDVSTFFPKEVFPKKQTEEIVIFVEGLFEKPERTNVVRRRLANAIKLTTKKFFPNLRINECFVRPFNPENGFSSI